MLDLREQKIVVTGGTGFLGKHLVEKLKASGCKDVIVPLREPGSWTNDLRRFEEAESVTVRADIVFHLAALCGGIGANQQRPADFMMHNLLMGLNLIRASSVNGVKKLVMVGTLCAFPKDTDGSIKPEHLWAGYPEPTNAPYGIAKRTLCEVGKAYHQQYGLNVVNVMPTNMFGPGDNFDPQTSHVIPAMIRRFVEARERGREAVTCWGTGSATRDFLHVSDATLGLIRAAAMLDDPEPVLLGSGEGVSMKDLAEMIADIVGYTGRIEWDATKPDGQPVRCVDTKNQVDRLGFVPTKSLRDGIRETVAWYEGSR